MLKAGKKRSVLRAKELMNQFEINSSARNTQAYLERAPAPSLLTLQHGAGNRGGTSARQRGQGISNVGVRHRCQA